MQNSFRPAPTVAVALLCTFLSSTACSPTPIEDNGEAASGGDLCALNGRYGDGICDLDCPQYDTDCSADDSRSDTETDDETGDETSTQTTGETGNETNDETVDETGNETNDETVDETGNETNDETVDETGNETNDETVDETGNETNDETVEETNADNPFYPGVPTYGTELWSKDFDGDVGHVPAVDASGNFYFIIQNSSSGGVIEPLKVIKMNSSGSVVWTWESEQVGESNWFTSAVTLGDDGEKLFININDISPLDATRAATVALSTSSGDELWRAHPTFPDSPSWSFAHHCGNIAARSNQLVFACWGNSPEDGFLVAMDADGNESWKKNGVDHGQPTFDAHGNIVTCTEDRLGTYGLDPSTGDSLWYAGLGEDYRCTDDIVPVASGRIHVLGRKHVGLDPVYKIFSYDPPAWSDSMTWIDEDETAFNVGEGILAHTSGGLVTWQSWEYGNAEVRLFDDNLDEVWSVNLAGDMGVPVIDADGRIHACTDNDSDSYSHLVTIDDGEVVGALQIFGGNGALGTFLGTTLLPDGTRIFPNFNGSDAFSISWTAVSGDVGPALGIKSQQGGTPGNSNDPLLGGFVDDDDNTGNTTTVDDEDTGNESNGNTTVVDDDTVDNDVSSCESRGCGDFSAGAFCQCTDDCLEYGDCCSDYEEVCANDDPPETLCAEQGCGDVVFGASCQCTDDCVEYGDCCSDYQDVCG